MRTLPYFLILLLLSCQPSANKKQFSSHLESDLKTDEHQNFRELLPEPDVLERLQFQLEDIDSAKAHNLLLAETVQLAPKKIELNESASLTLAASCSLWKDQHGAIVIIEETLTNDKNDLLIVYQHYFDKKKKTFAFSRTTAFNKELFKKELTQEKITEFYDADFNRVHRKYALTDNNHHPIKKSDCLLYYDFPFEVYGDCEDYLLKIKEGFKQVVIN